ncbi:DUF423 domain-containing protein [Lacipirellula limnantheis]|uniref:DUF423 domain-containing protein n=1 Tax=Lacipirellula limnantheis TaxID=2528024 RepID=A0A517TUV2_9BACT|nr:DUF423 domain-containing protein [Lacipirellula limnantheis]QDT72151.1 hypothetical protein I41_13180 [Lacipirellula limnantheis]
MNPKLIAIVGALLAAAGVGLGAFGAHGLENFLREIGRDADLAKRLAWFETGVKYQLYHALGLVAVAALAATLPGSGFRAATIGFVVGVVLFSGSLYAMTFLGDEWRKLGMITPLGGLAFIVGWIAVAVAAWKS